MILGMTKASKSHSQETDQNGYQICVTDGYGLITEALEAQTYRPAPVGQSVRLPFSPRPVLTAVDGYPAMHQSRLEHDQHNIADQLIGQVMRNKLINRLSIWGTTCYNHRPSGARKRRIGEVHRSGGSSGGAEGNRRDLQSQSESDCRRCARHHDVVAAIYGTYG